MSSLHLGPEPPLFNELSTEKHEQFNMQQLDDVKVISDILNSCEMYDKSEFKLSKDRISKSKSTFSILFNNIDGNASNFDSFVADLNQYDMKFTIIAIAETNCDEENKGIYTIPGYESEYNSKFLNKSKGSGLGLYVNSDFQFSKLDKFCSISENMESLFVEITDMDDPHVIGTIYRPPSGDLNKFNSEFEALLRELQDQNVHISGDFNCDLFSKVSDQFEQIIYENSLIQSISLATHERPGCKPSLIDNIIVNSTDQLLLSGVLKSSVSHHFPIFNIFEYSTQKKNDSEKKLPKYDFCETNVDKFEIDMENEILKHANNFEYHEENFNGFLSFLNSKIEDNFLVDEGTYKNSKRNRLFNPWITNGIITYIQKKIYFYNEWKKSCTVEDELGNEELYIRYKNFRFELRKLIKAAKRNYYCKKFESVQVNMKKTWQLINELRGKTKTNIKASFIPNRWTSCS